MSKSRRKIGKSRSLRVNIMCGQEMDIETLRFRRDLAARDGDMEHALMCAMAIDRRKRKDK